MPKNMHFVLEDQPELAGDTLVWLTKEKRDWYDELPQALSATTNVLPGWRIGM
jgi:hypothetical protein